MFRVSCILITFMLNVLPQENNVSIHNGNMYIQKLAIRSSKEFQNIHINLSSSEYKKALSNIIKTQKRYRTSEKFLKVAIRADQFLINTISGYSSLAFTGGITGELSQQLDDMYNQVVDLNEAQIATLLKDATTRMTDEAWKKIANSLKQDEYAQAKVLKEILNNFYSDNIPEKQLAVSNQAISRFATRVALTNTFQNEKIKRQLIKEIEFLRSEQKKLDEKVVKKNKEVVDKITMAFIHRQNMENSIAKIADQTTRLSLNIDKIHIETKKSINANSEKIEKNNRRINLFEKSLKRHKTSILQNKKFIVSIGERVSFSEKQIAKLTNAQSFTEELLYGNLNDESKLTALKNREFLKNKLQGRKRHLEILRLQAKIERDKSIREVENITNSLNKAYQIAVNLGFKGKSQKKVAKILKYTNAASQAYIAYQKGDYLGTVLSVSSLFGKKSKSPKEKRFEAIMQAISGLNYKLDQVLKNQQTIIINQQKISELVIKTHRLVMTNLVTLSSEIALIQDHVIAIQRIALQEAKDRAAGCHLFLNSREGYKFWNFKNGRFVSYLDMQKHYVADNSNRINCWSGIKALEKILIKDRQNVVYDPIFYMASHSANNLEFMKYVNGAYLPALKYFESTMRLGKHDSNFKLAINYLLAPSKKREQSDQWIYAASQKNDWFSGKESELIKEEVLQHLLYPPVIEQYCHYVLQMVPYLELTSEDNSLYLRTPSNLLALSAEDEMTRQVRSRRAQRLLEKMLEIVRSSLVQQNLLSGHCIMPFLEKDFQDVIHNVQIDKQRKKALFKLLNSNNFIRENLLRRLVYKHLYQNEISQHLYWQGWMTGSKQHFQKLFPNKWNLELKNDIWFLVVDKQFLPLPEPKTVSEEIFQVTDYIDVLEELQKHLEIAISEYGIFSQNHNGENERFVLLHMLQGK
ncbi:hypothetical protein [Candidatus Uabimicrobium amorphum]|uniref:Uncharacterized protein n=1 Tax=Uabimicrobium amorphum TaxID=2596890 RepID=A0A5S9IMF2_UABAM|nr:hypothetical protein [Candidatus Uabimicrobium amorphum]BBM84559.1 hypothetical protein UABAM_02920 [Candidatus Uabimicrobium amorphum]